MTLHDAHRTIDAIWRIESPKLIAGLTRMVRDVGVAEELAQDAVVAALDVQWPESGIPRNPGAWLMAIAKRRAIDRFRRDDGSSARTNSPATSSYGIGGEDELSTRSTTTSATICCA
jgi:predicted RNA polymerase sigma factor